MPEILQTHLFGFFPPLLILEGGDATESILARSPTLTQALSKEKYIHDKCNIHILLFDFCIHSSQCWSSLWYFVFLSASLIFDSFLFHLTL